ncbi:MAG: Rieske (2Fe-2S) protein [Gammaproteobacteria bacterium]|nr:Rieske (2Fe-2S) protein [Gammaproteobacteria bacterium]
MKVLNSSETNTKEHLTETQPAQWVKVCTTKDVPEGTAKVYRHDGKQVSIFAISRGYLACNNRCPHQGYPLSEGCITEDGILTCNWHNWKFDLTSDGKSLKGGESVRTYPLEVREGDIWIDMKDPPFEEQYARLVNSLQKSVRDNSYDHIARELSRLQLLGADLTELVAKAIEWTYDRLEYGWTHAYAGAADWLTLFDAHVGDPEKQLICILEAVGHMADDTLRRPIYPYTTNTRQYSSTEFLGAIEREDEDKAVSLLRGALDQGLHYPDLEEDLSTAALAHYNDFGHALIYVAKAGQLIARLGEQAELPILLALTRSLVFTTREDQIPQFRHYATVLDRWDGCGNESTARWQDFRGLSINQSLEKAVSCRTNNPSVIYEALLAANANNMLHFSLDFQDSTTNNIDDNVGWLSFTHTLTFANAVRSQCEKFPHLWPPALLQMACFLGRNKLYVDLDSSQENWFVASSQSFYQDGIQILFDHGKEEFIVSVHLLKTLLAAQTESLHTNSETGRLVTAAMNRFLGSPMKRKHVLRTVRQARQTAKLDL